MMNDNIDYSEDFEDEDYEEWVYFHEELQKAISPLVKMVLNKYFGPQLFNLQSETYLQIEKAVEEDFIFVDNVPDIFYNNRITEDEVEEERLYSEFIASGKKIMWVDEIQWFEDILEDEEDYSMDFLQDIDPYILSENDKKVIDLVTEAGSLLEDHARMAHFTRFGYYPILKAIRKYMEKENVFDLANLSEKGFVELQDTIDMFISTLLENLYRIVTDD